MRRAGRALLVLLLALAPAACGEAGSNGTTNVQGGTGRAPGAPPVGSPPAGTPTGTPTGGR
jgi:hypothetical protein